MEKFDYYVDITDPAKADLEGIDDYISNDLGVPQTADKMINSLEMSLNKLSQMPYIHPKVRDVRLSAQGYRWLGVKNYVAFFTIDEGKKIVHVERILYGRREWQRIL